MVCGEPLAFSAMLTTAWGPLTVIEDSVSVSEPLLAPR
jgi:hypothetical protein